MALWLNKGWLLVKSVTSYKLTLPELSLYVTMTQSQDLPQFEDHSKQEHRYSTCYMCACRCGIKVTIEDEKIRFVQGNPDHPVNKGVLCAKGNSAIMKQLSPAKLTQPLMRKPGTERGAGEFEPISWDAALDILTARLANIRATDPKKLAYFTGRDQMQALTGLWASQFGTINWAAHGGFCSVNMAAAGLYTMGHSFWEFGDPDWENTKYFMMWGVAEDHASNPIKLGLKRIKERGAKFVAVNPVRTGYQAIADEWIAITPGSDAMFALSMMQVLLREGLIDDEFLIRYTNGPQLVINNPGQQGDDLLLRDAKGNPQIWDQHTNSLLCFPNFIKPHVTHTPFYSCSGCRCMFKVHRRAFCGINGPDSCAGPLKATLARGILILKAARGLSPPPPRFGAWQFVTWLALRGQCM